MGEREERIMICATYSILYANDIACNEVIALREHIKNQDKETLKIYMALEKRAKNYLRDINEIIAEHSWFFSDYCSQMDELLDHAYEKLKKAIMDAFCENIEENANVLAAIETTRVLIDMADANFKFMTKFAGRYSKKAYLLSNCMIGRIREMPRIVDNLAKWAYRHIDKTICLYDYKDIGDAIKEISDIFHSIQNISDSYKIAEEQN